IVRGMNASESMLEGVNPAPGSLHAAHALLVIAWRGPVQAGLDMSRARVARGQPDRAQQERRPDNPPPKSAAPALWSRMSRRRRARRARARSGSPFDPTARRARRT